MTRKSLFLIGMKVKILLLQRLLPSNFLGGGSWLDQEKFQKEQSWKHIGPTRNYKI